MHRVQVEGIEIEVQESTMRKTDRGVEGRARVRMPDGRTVEMSGRWEDPYKACQMPGYEETGAIIYEDVQIDGKYQVQGENSIQIPYVRADGVEDVIEIETIAGAIAE